MRKTIEKFKNWITDPKTKECAIKSAEKVMPLALAFTVVGAGMALGGASAGDAPGLFTTVVEWIGKLALGIAIFYAIFGVVHYASANSEGDGPAKQKAIMQITAGVLLAIVSALLTSNAATLADYVTT